MQARRVPSLSAACAVASIAIGLAPVARAADAPVGAPIDAPAAGTGPAAVTPPTANELPPAGYSGEAIYVKDPNNRLVLFPGIRLQVDGYGFAGRGVKDYQRPNGTGLKTNLGPRRTRLELGGRALDRFYFFFGGEFGGTALDGTERPASTAAFADAFVGVDLHPLLNVQLGQFDVPFMMESFTSDKYLDFMERSLTVRAAGAPYDKDMGLMLRGESARQQFNYAVAVVGGNGKNRPGIDNRVTVMGRAFVLPLAASASPLARMHVGVSARWGKRDPDFTFYDAPSMITPGGYVFWAPVGSKGTTETHVIPSNQQSAFAGELYVPLERFDLRGEVVYVSDGRREAYPNELYASQRAGLLYGLAYYVQLSMWPWGRPRVNGEPGFEPTPRLRTTPSPEPPDALQIAVRWEQLLLKYDSVHDSPSSVARGPLDSDGTNTFTDIKVDAFQIATTYWATKHFRFTAEYSAYLFPGTPSGSYSRLGVFNTPTGAPTNQAGAPGARANGFAFDANALHEFSIRAAVAL